MNNINNNILIKMQTSVLTALFNWTGRKKTIRFIINSITKTVKIIAITPNHILKSYLFPTFHNITNTKNGKYMYHGIVNMKTPNSFIENTLSTSLITTHPM
ncbi:MAG: hypothetical protein J6Y82_06515 [Bacteroidales bacterium]|nr:hypothetical protein [Bacteroidales bacterium]